MTDPSVLIIGGFPTIPLNYIGLRRLLLRRGAARVEIAPLWTPDWLLAGIVGFGPITRRAARAIAATYRAAGAKPIIVIAHSGGGVVARLAMSERPFNGRVAGVSTAVGCFVTLGTPHGLNTMRNPYHHAGHEAMAFLDRESPGAYFAPRTAYLSVAGLVELEQPTWPAGRFIAEIFRMIVGEESDLNGDGIVPVAAAHLEGATQLTLNGVVHGTIGSPWFGDEEIIDSWWPTALELWRAALEVRRQPSPALDQDSVRQDLDGSLELDVAGWSSGSSSGS